jgi:hypothetical protein
MTFGGIVLAKSCSSGGIVVHFAEQHDDASDAAWVPQRRRGEKGSNAGAQIKQGITLGRMTP